MTIDDILASLEKRGFYDPFLREWRTTTQTQIDAVIEELGEVARSFRRFRQGVDMIDDRLVEIEAADVVIAAVCLLGAVAGDRSGDVIRAKLEADEKRGHLHNGGAS